jgi:hypoxanthine phosphoribosyltransferase
MNDADIREIISEEKINERVQELGDEISKHYRGKHLTIVAISNGALIFLSDLVRKISIPVRIDTISASSYSGTESSGEVVYSDRLKLEVKDCYVILLDDILDTGRTLTKLKSFLETFSPIEVKTCVFLDKPSRRVVQCEGDFVGFNVPDEFVVGYGLDFNEYYRNLPYIGTLSL